ncbi:hypothetical protein [uncultured Sphingomonas sp.]|uniref:hypothetical protein n=1 Tax=uncultured Sphingomonas sp. TaxID=158754 RepID=UPI0035CC40EC
MTHLKTSPAHIVLAALALATATAALAQTPTTRAASRAWVRTEFARADVNRDGVLARGEVTRAVNRHHGRLSTGRSRILTNMWFNRLDGNRSNSIGRDEAQTVNDEFWDRFDRNRDGRLGPRERGFAEAFLKNPAR